MFNNHYNNNNRKDYIKTLNPTIKLKDDDNISIMNDQDILDYLNTNNNEKKNLIKKILNQRFINKSQKSFVTIKNINNNNRMINLDNMNSYSYINTNTRRQKNIVTMNNYEYKDNNYNYNNSCFNNKRRTINFHTNYSNTYRYINDNFNNDTNSLSRIFINKRMFNSTNKENHSNDNDKRDEYKTKKINYFSSNLAKKLIKMNSHSNIRSNNYNIVPKEINILAQESRIVIPCEKKNKFNNINNDTCANNNIINCPKLKKIQKNIYTRKKNLNLNVNSYTKNFKNDNIDKIPINKNINKNNDDNNNNNYNYTKKELNKRKSKIPNSGKYKKMDSIGINDNIDKSNKNIISDEKKYQINNVINEQFNKDKSDKKECAVSVSVSESDNLRISMQSINDSKMMELAKNYIKEEDNLNINEINQILNSKKGGN